MLFVDVEVLLSIEEVLKNNPTAAVQQMDLTSHADVLVIYQHAVTSVASIENVFPAPSFDILMN